MIDLKLIYLLIVLAALWALYKAVPLLLNWHKRKHLKKAHKAYKEYQDQRSKMVKM